MSESRIFEQSKHFLRQFNKHTTISSKPYSNLNCNCECMAQMKRSGDIGGWEDHGEPFIIIRGTDATFLEQTTGLPPLVPSRLNAPGLILVREVKLLW